MIDHHTATDEFARFCKQEEKVSRDVSADYPFIIPPTSASTTKVFFMNMKKIDYLPDFIRFSHIDSDQSRLGYPRVVENPSTAMNSGCPFHEGISSHLQSFPESTNSTRVCPFVG